MHLQDRPTAVTHAPRGIGGELFFQKHLGAGTWAGIEAMAADSATSANAMLQIREAAALVHAFLGQLGLQSFLKTSGGKGLHLVVPLRRVHDWATVKGFSQAIVQHMCAQIPARFVAKSGPRNRMGKIFID